MFALAAAMLLTSAADIQPSRSPAADPADRRLCRIQETLGSITPRRVCKTAAQWAQIDAAMARSTQRNLDHMNNHPSGMTGVNSAD